VLSSKLVVGCRTSASRWSNSHLTRPLSAWVETSDTLIYSLKRLKNGKADIKTFRKKLALLIVSESAKDLLSGEFVPLLGDTGFPNNEQQSLTQSQLLVYVFFICCSPNSANPFQFRDANHPDFFRSVPNQANSTPICRTRFPFPNRQ
jgi:hypothetical protein